MKLKVPFIKSDNDEYVLIIDNLVFISHEGDKNQSNCKSCGLFNYNCMYRKFDNSCLCHIIDVKNVFMRYNRSLFMNSIIKSKLTNN